MADALMGQTEIAAASKADVSSVVQSFLIQEAKLLGKVSDYSQFAVKGAKSVDLPISGGFSAVAKAENVASDSQIITYAADTITFNQHDQVQWLNEEIADNQAAINLLQDQLMKASKALALQVDTDIVTELKLASASAPDHQVVFASTGDDIVALGDVLAAKALLETQNIEFNECYIGVGPEKMNEMLAIASFIQAERWGNSEPIQKGVIGSIYGAKVVQSSLFADFMCTWHPSAVGIAFQRGATFQSQADLANLGIRYSLDQRYGVEVLDSGKRCVLTDSTS